VGAIINFLSYSPLDQRQGNKKPPREALQSSGNPVEGVG
jgi:hypothetical protein